MQPRQRNIVIVGMFAMLMCSATQAHVPGACERLVSNTEWAQIKLGRKLTELGMLSAELVVIFDRRITTVDESLDAFEELTDEITELLGDLNAYVLSSNEAITCISSN